MSFKNAMQATQKAILQYARQGRPYEVLAAVLAARQFNTTIQETDLQANAGQKRMLKINYYAPVCEDNGTGNENMCDGGNTVPIKQAFFEITKKVASAVYQLNREDIRQVDGSFTFSDHAKAAINADVPVKPPPTPFALAPIPITVMEINIINIVPRVNQTGTATGTVRGILINPNLISAPDFRVIVMTNNSGYGIFQSGTGAKNYFNGNTGIKITNPTEALEVGGNIKTAQPSANGAGAIKIGKVITGTTVTIQTDKYLEVEIDGVIRKLAIVN